MKQETIVNYRVNIGNNVVSVSPFHDISVDVIKSLIDKFAKTPNYTITFTKNTQVYNVPEESDKKPEPKKDVGETKAEAPKVEPKKEDVKTPADKKALENNKKKMN